MSEELKAALKLLTEHKDDEEVAKALKVLVPEKKATVKESMDFLEGDDAGQVLLNTFADKKVTIGTKTAIDNFKKKGMPEILKEKLDAQETELIKKYNPQQTEAEKKLAETEKRILDLEKLNGVNAAKAVIAPMFAKKDIDQDFVELFVTANLEESIAAAEKFLTRFDEAVKTSAQGTVKKTFKEHGYDPDNPPVDKNKGEGAGKVTAAQVEQARQNAISVGTEESRVAYALVKKQLNTQNSAE